MRKKIETEVSVKDQIKMLEDDRKWRMESIKRAREIEKQREAEEQHYQKILTHTLMFVLGFVFSIIIWQIFG